MKPVRPLRAIRGVVTNAAGVRVRFGKAFLFDAMHSRISMESTQVISEDGHFSIPVADGAVQGSVGVLAPGFVPWQSAPIVGIPEGELNVVLESGAVIEGRILDERDAPVPGIVVIASGLGNTSLWPNSTSGLPSNLNAVGAEAKADHEGHFLLTGLVPKERFRVRLLPIPEWCAWGDPVTVSAGDRNVVLRARPLARLNVRLVDDSTGERIDSAFTIVRDSPRGMQISTPFGLPVKEAWTDGSPSSLTLYIARDTLVGSKQGADERSDLAFSASAPGYQSFETRLLPRFGFTEHLESRMSPTGNAPLRPVRFSAEFASHRPFTGSLGYRLGGVVIPVVIADGASLPLVRLPPDSVIVAPSGVGARGAWWLPAGAPATIPASSGVRADTVDVKFVLRGGLVHLDVREESGQSVRDFDLDVTAVERPDSARGAMTNWAERARREAPGTDAPSLWLPLGRKTLHVVAADGLRGTATVDVPDDGSEVTSRVVVR